MVGTKSRGYSNSGRLSEGEYSMPFFSTRHSPNVIPFSGVLGECTKFCQKDILCHVVISWTKVKFLYLK